jgi:hypothetical protein
MIVKRLVGNRSLPPTGRARVVWNRLLLDRDAA